ncbi:hypothetical protein BaRGS_00021894 [Batillaria attramentaria]|uniref:Uncharacterized protein n=1 Tax=Batillaria attramentaria TaxID=370345 RepID=A0ABD0KI72_9CAEN
MQQKRKHIATSISRLLSAVSSATDRRSCICTMMDPESERSSMEPAACAARGFTTAVCALYGEIRFLLVRTGLDRLGCSVVYVSVSLRFLSALIEKADQSPSASILLVWHSLRRD